MHRRLLCCLLGTHRALFVSSYSKERLLVSFEQLLTHAYKDVMAEKIAADILAGL